MLVGRDGGLEPGLPAGVEADRIGEGERGDFGAAGTGGANICGAFGKPAGVVEVPNNDTLGSGDFKVYCCGGCGLGAFGGAGAGFAFSVLLTS